MELRYEKNAGQCVERYCALVKNASQLKHAATPCIDDNQLKQEDVNVVGELASVCAQIVQKCLYIA